MHAKSHVVKTESAIFDWIEQHLHPRISDSTELIYDDMESQSDRTLPVIYRPFDCSKRSHWCDRGALFDYLCSARGGRLLDFGPGDGWPSLIVAPFVDCVVGVDSSKRRVDVCTENAKRLGIANASFVHVRSGDALPFDDSTFDGAMAASSIEQTSNPRSTIGELHRVIRNGGHLRIFYESLNRYRGTREYEAGLLSIGPNMTRLLLYSRQPDDEVAVQYGVTISRAVDELRSRLDFASASSLFDLVTVAWLGELLPDIVDARVCRLVHPSGKTLRSWLIDAGFREVLPTRSGSDLAAKFFDAIPQSERPIEMSEVDKLLQPLVEVEVQLPAPIEDDPMITAIK